ncbi:sigma factor AlgU regulatory protein MucB [Halovibrio variabilis]|uniref:Sigma factor AlgU regulatory protein MucB n=1 Tax=Halovibrio variabilis TaxID=31910 RepID=A0A511UQN2_9GAMM|nr:MucB/RseB C-terminal domain-containing protein [Halovibrio variabilis]GEN27472.1 sigma factor AlgU regulatory protein MucB [Halovibrio variabilis]
MMVLWRAKQLGVLVLAVGLFPFQAHAENAENRSESHPGYECSGSAKAMPSNAIQWLERSLWASHCYAFQARAVAIDAINVRTLALSHRIQDGIRQQVVQYLDGPSVSIERRSPVGRLAWTQENSNGELPTPAKWAAHLDQYYTVELEDNERVAGRDAVKLDFDPRDEWRFSHQWWVDRETGLLLKHVLSDKQGRIIETFQITQLQSPQQYTGSVRMDAAKSVLSTPWRVTWLPDGFVAQPATFAGDDGHQRLYSDGLATVSVFVEPLGEEETTALREGVQQLGVSAVAIEHYVTTQGRWQLVAIGEMPVTTLQRIARSITFDQAAVDSVEETEQVDTGE